MQIDAADCRQEYPGDDHGNVQRTRFGEKKFAQEVRKQKLETAYDAEQHSGRQCQQAEAHEADADQVSGGVVHCGSSSCATVPYQVTL